MKYATKQFTNQCVPGASCQAIAIGCTRKPLRNRYLIATALTGVLASAYFGSAQAGDYSPESRMMRPLYAVSLDAGNQHVLSYFLSKNKQCDLTVMVTERPKETPKGKKILPLESTRFSATIDGGQTARIATSHGRALDYICAKGANLMTVREVSQVAAAQSSVR